MEYKIKTWMIKEKGYLFGFHEANFRVMSLGSNE